MTTSVSGSIADSEDVTFIHETFPVPPSKRAKIGVDVYPPNHIPFPVWIGIYTTRDHVNIKRQCTESVYGQVKNRDLHLEIGSPQNLKCDSFSNNITHCTGHIIIQDFKPRNFSFSFGFRCDETSANRSLRGLHYNMSIFVTNEMKCSELEPIHTSLCSQSDNGVFPNLFGGKRNDISFNVMLASEACYQHSNIFLCDLYIPRCDPKSNEVIPPCREMCHDYLNGCDHIAMEELKHMNCNYLPSSNGSIPCVDWKVSCSDPPTVAYSTVVLTGWRNYTAEYSCNEGYSLDGKRAIFCMYNGRWSKHPFCVRPFRSMSSLELFLFVLVCLVLSSITVLFVRSLIKQMRKQELRKKLDGEKPRLLFRRKKAVPLLPRKRESDAFVLYHFDSDDDFVIGYLLPELEETCGFKLIIHSRDFTPGSDIQENIEESVNNSNSAIIVMSQGFVDSIWCKEEFTHCYLENMKDPAFKLFVIMMQPADNLDNLSPYMKKHVAKKTYLQIDDPELFSKLAIQLEKVRKLDNEDVDENDDCIDSDEEFDLVWPRIQIFR